MNRGERMIVEQKLNLLRARFITSEGKLDRAVMDKYSNWLKCLKELGYRVVLDDFRNKLVLEKIA